MQLTALLCWLAFLINLVTAENPNPLADYSDTSQSYRLPNETYPKHYDITITTNVHTGETSFHGDVIIDIVVAKATRNIVLHSRQLEISEVMIGNEYNEWEELYNEYELKREFLILKRKNSIEFPADTKWKLVIKYSGELNDDGNGFGLYKYLDDEGKNHYLAATYFFGTNARYAFPCYDEPAKRANFTITVYHSPSYTAVSNMPVNQQLSSANKTVFLTTALIPTYLVAFVVSDLEYTELTFNGIRQRVYSRPSMKPEHIWPLWYSTLILEYMSKFTGVEFMLPKLDHVVIPNYIATAMENWGLITHSEGSFKYNQVNSATDKLITSPIYMAQMISAQWFGGFITNQWWNYLWLNGGLFALFAFKALDNIFPNSDVWQQKFHVFYEIALTSYHTKPLSLHMQSPNEFDTSMGYIGNSVLHMWNCALTDKVFRKAIQTFLKNNQYGAVGEQQLFTAIQNAAEEEYYGLPATIDEMMRTWTHQSGYPLLTITRNYENGTFKIKQEFFDADETVKDATTWHVPINFAVGSNPDFSDTEATHYLLNVSEIEVDAGISKTDWLVVNKQSTGLYRIKYDEENYKLITECLIARPFVIHFRNRAQLLDDAYRLSISNRLDHSILLKMLTYLKQEDRYAPFRKGYDIIIHYGIYLKKNYDYKLFVAELFKPHFIKLGIDEISGEDLHNKLMRTLVMNIACEVDVECLVETNSKVKALIKENIPIDSPLKWEILKNGLRQSGDEEFDFFYQKLMNSTKRERKELIESLSFSRNKDHLMKLLNHSIDESNEFSSQDRISVITSACIDRDTGFLACIEFLNKNWNVYGNLKSNSSKSYPLHDVIYGLARYVFNENAEEQLLALVAKVNNSEHVKPSLEMDVQKKIASRFKWLKIHGEPIMSGISEYIDKKRYDTLM